MLSTLQERVERSLFEAIRKVLVTYNYLPDITDEVRYPKNAQGAYTPAADQNWKTDLLIIAQSQGFSIELYGHSSPDSKGTKKVPRITIESNRTMPSEIGAPLDGIILANPNDEQTVLRQPLPYKASTLFFDIHLVSNKAAQDRVLNAVLSKALSNMKFIPFNDDATQLFLVEQYNYYESPDNVEGLEEKIYSYQIPDLYDVQEEAIPIRKMNEITIDTVLVEDGSSVDDQGNVIGVSEADGGLKVDDTGGHII